MIFLHGSNSGGSELQPLVEAMKPYASLRTPHLLGHGGRPIPARIDMQSLAEDVIAGMDREGIEREVIGGYSFGGTVALYVARHFPQRVSGVVTLAAKHAFDPTTMAHWKYLVGHERLERLRFPWGSRVPELERLHAPNHWKDVADANRRLFDVLAEAPPLPPGELRAIEAPVAVVSSDLDQIVPWEETMALARALRRPHVAMFHGSAHPLRTLPLLAIARTIDEWMRTNGLKA